MLNKQHRGKAKFMPVIPSNHIQYRGQKLPGLSSLTNVSGFLVNRNYVFELTTIFPFNHHIRKLFEL